MSFFEFLQIRHSQILSLLLQHIQVTAVSIFLATLIGIPLGIFMSRSEKLRGPVLGVINACQAVPSLAFMGMLIPVIGIGKQTAIVLVIIYAVLPIVKNTCTGILNVDPEVVETATGIGLTKMQTMFRVQLPLSLPVIMAGIKIAAVGAVGTVTIAAYAGGIGLGYLVYSGISMVDVNMVFSGALPACILALLIDFLLGKVEKLVTSEGIIAGEKVID